MTEQPLFNLSVQIAFWAYEAMECSEQSAFHVTDGCPYPGLTAEALRIFSAKSGIALHLLPHVSNYSDAEETVRNNTANTFSYCEQSSERLLSAGVQFAGEKLHGLFPERYAVLSIDRKVPDTVFGESISYLLVFQPQLWFAVLLTAACLQLYTVLFKEETQRQINGQGHALTGNMVAGLRCLLWMLFTIFSFDLYANGILTQLLVDFSKPLFDNEAQLAELIRTHKLTPVMYTSYPFYQSLVGKSNDIDFIETKGLNNLRNALKSNPPLNWESRYVDLDVNEQYVQGIVNTSIVHALHEQKVFITYAEQVHLLRSQLCGVRVMPLRTVQAFENPCYMAFSNSTPHWVVEKFNNITRTYWGTFTALRVRYERYSRTRQRACDFSSVGQQQLMLRSVERPNHHVLSLQECWILFLVLVVGSGVALLCLICENIPLKTVMSK